MCAHASNHEEGKNKTRNVNCNQLKKEREAAKILLNIDKRIFKTAAIIVFFPLL